MKRTMALESMNAKWAATPTTAITTAEVAEAEKTQNKNIKINTKVEEEQLQDNDDVKLATKESNQTTEINMQLN